MSSFARIDDSGNVSQVVVIPEHQSYRGAEFLSVDLNLGGYWIEVNNENSYEGQCSPEFIYDKNENIFFPPQPHPWFILDKENKKWICPAHLDETTGQEIENFNSEFHSILQGIPSDIFYRKES